MRHLRFVIAALLLAVVFGAPPARADEAADEAAPEVSIIDGDTLLVGHRIVNLSGIDAPELGQRCMIEGKDWRCGLEAALALRKMKAFGTVGCTSQDEGIVVTGFCQIEGKDMGEVLLGQGYAVALPDAPPNYQAAMAAAKDAKLGLWRGDFILPANWRQGERLDGETTDPTFCVVKGVITEDDQKIFYVPSDKIYNEVTVNPDKGEKMFCSDDEAILAGWYRFPRQKP